MATTRVDVLMSLLLEVGKVCDCEGGLGVQIRFAGCELKYIPAALKG
ncbi:MAG: hypothetical protein ABFD77_00750 [Thermotogota bacterium]